MSDGAAPSEVDGASSATGGIVDRFFASLPFPPDPFQVEAARAVEQGRSVVVTAPTGAGKTLVAEAAVYLALARGRRAVYTTPLKALSNQKYGDFVAEYGADKVGLLTGDNVINGDAPIVVMTTEVLRNMIYAQSPGLADLEVAVLDEVHYLQDPFRGPVWEEIIIHAPRHVKLVCLSATVSNPEEFTAWVRERRGPTDLVIERHRPVPLEARYLLKDLWADDPLRMFPLFRAEVVDERPRPNPAIVKLLARGKGRRRRFVTPRRHEVIERLDEEGMLPAIVFIFSRAGCESAAQQLVAAGFRTTTPEEAEQIRRIAEDRVSHLDDTDLAVLGYGRWLDQLAAGVAPHHAGMVPAFKETVEELFAAGLVKVVFATETLALGINMPARTVVLESLSKFNGETHELLQPGDFTQLTGRAGRRGIDVVGYGVVLYSPFVPFETVAKIASAGSHPLRSSFRPTYNMAANLIANYDRQKAEELLNASFGQFQRSRQVAKLERRLERARQRLAELERAAACEQGDVFDLLDAIRARVGRHDLEKAARAFARKLQPGDVVEVPDGRCEGRWVFLARERWTSDKAQVLLVGPDGTVRRCQVAHLPPGTAVLARIRLSERGNVRSRRFQREVGKLLRDLPSREVREVRAILRWPVPADLDHPVARCPDLVEHLRWAQLALRQRSRVARLEARLKAVGEGLVAEFHAILALLDEWGYTRGWNLTVKGRRLRFLYTEMDLLLAEAIETGLFADLRGPALAAFASVFVYEPRSDVTGTHLPTMELGDRWEALLDLWERLRDREEELGLAGTRRPEGGLGELVYHWAAGFDLEEILEDADMAAGDFVRTCRQLLDLLRQIRDADPDLAEPIREVLQLVDRGVVAAGGAV